MRGLALLLLLAGLGLQGCDGEPTRTVVHAPAAEAPAPESVAAPPAPVVAAVPTVAPAAPPPAARSTDDADGAQLLAQRPLQVPVVGVAPADLRDSYEQGRGARTHEAMDILAPTGTPVVAVDDGRIAKLFDSKPGGLTVYHFDPQGKLAYYYAHLDRYAAGLREGMEVKRGEVIGYVGTTGNADPGTPHLHFAVFKLGPEKRWWEGEPVNPYPAFRHAAPAEQVAGR